MITKSFLFSLKFMFGAKVLSANAQMIMKMFLTKLVNTALVLGDNHSNFLSDDRNKLNIPYHLSASAYLFYFGFQGLFT